MRWDFVFQLFGDNKEAMKHSTLSALLVSDKQDPALVGDITSLYKWFIKASFYALGLYLKAIQFLTECFYDKNFDSRGESLPCLVGQDLFCDLA